MRLLLDANSLLNAVFLPRSWSLRAVRAAKSRGHQILISNMVRDEALRTITNATADTIIFHDPRSLILGFCSRLNVGIIYCGNYTGSEVQRHDQHVEAAARQADAITLTNDIQLATILKRLRMAVCYPLQLVAQFEPQSISTVFFGERPLPTEGSFFFRGIPKGGTGTPDEILEAFSWPDFSIQYSFRSEQWMVIANGAHLLTAPYALRRDESLVFALSWANNQISFRLEGVPHPAVRDLSFPVEVNFHEEAKLVPRYNGTIFLATMDDRPLGPRMWRKAISDPPYSSPNPYDVDRCRAAIRRFAWLGSL